MDRLRQIIEEIAARLKTLERSQRIAIAMCAGMVIFSMIWLMQWSTEPEMAQLVNREFTFSELDAAEEALRSNGIQYELHGNRVFVEMAERHSALRLLHKAAALPDGSLYDMDTVVNDQNPFLSPDARSYAQNYATGNELAKIIATSPFVESASVMLNPKSKRRLGGQSDVPTASVAVTLARNTDMTEEMVDGFAKLVSGAVAGLKPHNVFITDTRTGRSFNVPSPNDVASFDVLGMQKKRERHLQSKITDALAYIPGVRVAVSVELETSKRVTERMQHEVAQPKVETSQVSELGTQTSSAEAGVQANLGQAITAGGAGQTSMTEQTKTENFEPKLTQREMIEDIPFATKKATASIGIPRSFVASIFSARYPQKETASDDDQEFVGLRDEQVSRVKQTVQRIVMSRNDDAVDVYVYPDMDWSIDGGTWSATPAGVTIAAQDGIDPLDLAKSYGPQVGLGFLALFSMFMMLRVVKSTPKTPPLPETENREEDLPHDEPTLASGSYPVGRASVSESLLVAQEVDDDTLRYQELGQEVAKMVEKDPDGAAELIRRWMDEG